MSLGCPALQLDQPLLLAHDRLVHRVHVDKAQPPRSSRKALVHAIENDLPLPIGAQGAEVLDARREDEDLEEGLLGLYEEDEEETDEAEEHPASSLIKPLLSEEEYRRRAEEVTIREPGPEWRRRERSPASSS